MKDEKIKLCDECEFREGDKIKELQQKLADKDKELELMDKVCKKLGKNNKELRSRIKELKVRLELYEGLEGQKEINELIDELKCVQRCNDFNKEIIIVSELEEEIGIERVTVKKETM